MFKNSDIQEHMEVVGSDGNMSEWSTTWNATIASS